MLTAPLALISLTVSIIDDEDEEEFIPKLITMATSSDTMVVSVPKTRANLSLSAATGEKRITGMTTMMRARAVAITHGRKARTSSTKSTPGSGPSKRCKQRDPPLNCDAHFPDEQTDSWRSA